MGRHKKVDMDPIKRSRIDRMREQRRLWIGKYNNEGIYSEVFDKYFFLSVHTVD